jgi:hypothetical protein
MKDFEDTQFLCLSNDLSIDEDANKLFASFLVKNIWADDSLITFAYKDGCHDDITSIVLTTFNPLMNKIKFVFSTDYDNAMIRIAFEPNEGTWSYTGTNCLKVKSPKSTMNLEYTDERTVLHEFGHVLGMIHEHQNPRHNPLKINEEKIYSWCKATYGWTYERTFTNILKPYSIEQTNGSSFDEKSIMLYYFPSFLLQDGFQCSINSSLSTSDIQWIKKLYSDTNDKLHLMCNNTSCTLM